MLVHVVADYGLGDLAFAEVAQCLMQHLADAQLVLTPVPAFDTLSAGFCVALGRLRHPLRWAIIGTLVRGNSRGDLLLWVLHCTDPITVADTAFDCKSDAQTRDFPFVVYRCKNAYTLE